MKAATVTTHPTLGRARRTSTTRCRTRTGTTVCVSPVTIYLTPIALLRRGNQANKNGQLFSPASANTLLGLDSGEYELWKAVPAFIR